MFNKKKQANILPYALHLGNDKTMGFLVGDSKEMRPRQGHNKENDQFYIQLTHYKTKDQMRVWMTLPQFEAYIINCQRILNEYKRENPIKPGIVVPAPNEEETKDGQM